MLPAHPPNSRRMCIARKETFNMCSLSGRMWLRKWSWNTMMVSKAIEPQISALPGLISGCFTEGSLVVGDADLQACQLGRELDLAGQSRILPIGGKVAQQVLFIGMGRRQLREPLRIHVDMAGGAGAHAAADSRDAVVEVAQVFHQSEGSIAFDVVLDAIAVGNLDQSHETLTRLPMR